MTTPVPTTASAHQAMVEALYRLGTTYVSYVGERCTRCLNHPDTCHCDGHTARAALEGWEKREPLRDQGGLRDVVARFLFLYRRGEFAPAADVTSMLLDALEPLLFGTGPRTGGERG